MNQEQIESLATARGGFTKKQLAEWGISWPPPKGWKRALTSHYSAPAGASPSVELEAGALGLAPARLRTTQAPRS